MAKRLSLVVSLSFALAFSFAPLGAVAEEPAQEVETIVIVRHGEKPANDLGQLTCKGLNRALALPDVLIQKYGKPDFVFAPLPKVKLNMENAAASYSYVRPLATIEPTAIRAGLPVDTRFTFAETLKLQHELLSPRYRKAMVFVAWEHHLAEKFAKDLLATLKADSTVVPEWKGDDFDSIYLLKITSTGKKRAASFQREQEGLNDVSSDCPEAKAK